LNAKLKFDFIITLVVAEHILSSTVALTNYLQKCDIDLLEAATEANIVIRRFTNERNDVHVREAVLYEIASEFEIEASRLRVV
jgi:hypothetical protein